MKATRWRGPQLDTFPLTQRVYGQLTILDILGAMVSFRVNNCLEANQARAGNLGFDRWVCHKSLHPPVAFPVPSAPFPRWLRTSFRRLGGSSSGAIVGNGAYSSASQAPSHTHTERLHIIP